MTEPAPYRPLTYLAAHAARRPDAPAIYEDGATVSFAEFFDRVRGTMRALEEIGVQRGEVVGVSLPNAWEYVALEIAIPALGAVTLPLAPSLGSYELSSVLSRSSAAVVVTDDQGPDGLRDVAKSAPGVRLVVDVGQVAAVEHCSTAAIEPYPTRPEEIVQIALTSGTTGPPKLAALSAELKQVTFEGFTSRLGIVPDDRVLPLSPISQGVGEMCLYSLRVGACLIMTSERRFSADLGLRVARESRATVIGGVPTMIGRMFRDEQFDPAALALARVTAVAGAQMPPDLAENWERLTGSRLCAFYGAMDIGQLAVASPDDPPEKRWHTVGRPHARAESMICDPAGRSLGPGKVGEICMRGPLVQKRYWNEEKGPFAKDGWAHFGDVGFIDDDGFVHVIGRTKDIIIRGGENINPYEVEAVLLEHRDVAEVCLVGLADSDLGERVAACVVARPEHEVTLESLREFLAERGLAHYKWVERLLVIEELPLGSTGKVARNELRERVASAFADAPLNTGGERALHR